MKAAAEKGWGKLIDVRDGEARVSYFFKNRSLLNPVTVNFPDMQGFTFKD